MIRRLPEFFLATGVTGNSTSLPAPPMRGFWRPGATYPVIYAYINDMLAYLPGPGACLRLAGQVLLTMWLYVTCASSHAHDGDINEDSAVNLPDLLWGTQALTGQRMLTVPQEQRADVAPLVNGYSVPDGMFNLGDLHVLWRVVTGEIVLAFAGVPGNQFNLGDSIAVGEAADNTIGQAHRESVWSTGYIVADSVNSLNERLEALQPATYYENDDTRDSLFNHGVSGAVMVDFAVQAGAVAAASASAPGGQAGMVSVLLGNNDVCADSLAEMTDPALFEAQYRGGLDILAGSPATRDARIDVMSIPAIYWLWQSMHGSSSCRFIWFLGSVCQALLGSANSGCVSSASELDPDNDYGDAADSVCHRRKLFHRAIRDTYNPILQNVLQEYIDNGELPNARFTDIFDVQFTSADVNTGDCFHPNYTGHALLADTAWCRSPLGSQDPACTP